MSLCTENIALSLSHTFYLCMDMSVSIHLASSLSFFCLKQNLRFFLLFSLIPTDQDQSYNHVFIETQPIINCLYSRQIAERTKIQTWHCRVLEGQALYHKFIFMTVFDNPKQYYFRCICSFVCTLFNFPFHSKNMC